MKKIIIWLFVIGILAAGGVYLYIFHFGAKHADPLRARNLVEIEADSLYRLFENEEAAANKRFLGKAIKVTGKVEEVDYDGTRYTVSFVSGGGIGTVICEMDTVENNRIKAIDNGSNVTIAGFCNGLNLDVYLDRCKLAEDLPESD